MIWASIFSKQFVARVAVVAVVCFTWSYVLTVLVWAVAAIMAGGLFK